MSPSPRLVKVLVAACAFLFALVLALAVLFLRRPPQGFDQTLLDDPRVRDEVIAEFVDRAGGAYDSHNDPDVGRILQKNLHGKVHGTVPIDTNRFGMREVDYRLPKPAGLVRVVLLGDSFVFGTESRAEDRAGTLLQRWLRERSGSERVEVLHLGIMSWNVLAECAYVRRQLALLQPDLVIQITVGNDLDDTQGVRGFGALSRFSSRHRERADAAILVQHPALRMGMTKVTNPLLGGHDAESRERFGEARAAVTRLARALEHQGGKYLHLFRWPGMNAKMRRLIGGDLSDDQVGYLATTFANDQSTWVSADNKHWGPTGMHAVALVCYGLIVERRLLPTLTLEPWDPASAEVRRIHGAGIGEPSQPDVFAPELDEVFDFADFDSREGSHVYGGVDGRGLVAPFASLCLKNPLGSRIHLVAQCLERPELDGTTVTVSVEGLIVGTCELRAGARIDASWPLPPELLDAPFVNVRLVSDDWALAGDDLQSCVVMRLLSVAIAGEGL